MRLRQILSGFILAFLVFSFSAVGATAIHQNSTKLGERLEDNLFKTVKEKNWQALEDMIAPDVQSINSDATRNREKLIAYIKSLTFKDYKLSDFTVTQNNTGNILVVTYDATYAEQVGGKPEAGKKIKNLSVWKKSNGKWQWIAHAVLD